MRTPGGHRRFPVSEIQRLSAERSRTSGSAVRPLSPPTRPLPALGRMLQERGGEIADRVTGEVYGPGETGWFVSPPARPLLQRWIDLLATSSASGDFPRALTASRSFFQQAFIAGVSLLECYTLCERFMAATLRELGQSGADQKEVAGGRRLAMSLRQSLLDDYWAGRTVNDLGEGWYLVEQALRQMRRDFTAPGAMVLNDQLVVVAASRFASDYVRREFGVEDPIGLGFEEAYPPARELGLVEMVERTFESGHGRYQPAQDFSAVTGGEPRWWRVQTVPLTHGGQRLVALIGQDITSELGLDSSLAVAASRSRVTSAKLERALAMVGITAARLNDEEPLGDSLRRSLETLRAAYGLDHVGVWLGDRAPLEPTVVAGDPATLGWKHGVLPEPVAAEALRHSEPGLLFRPPVAAIVCPLRQRGEAIGVLIAAAEESRGPSEQDLMLWSTVADLAVAAVTISSLETEAADTTEKATGAPSSTERRFTR